MTKLSREVIYYQHTGKNFEEIRNKCLCLLFKAYNARRLYDEELFSEFILVISERLKSMVMLFKYDKSDFENYLFTTAKFVFMHTKKKMSVKYAKELSIFQYEAVETIQVAETVNEYEFISHYPENNLEEKETLSAQTVKTLIEKKYRNTKNFYKRTLWVLMKNAMFVKEDEINFFITISGMKRRKVFSYIKQARECVEANRIRIEGLKEKRNLSYLEYLATMQKLRKPQIENSMLILNKRAEMQYSRFTNFNKVIAGIKTTVANTEISRITGIPKGTIDSGLFMIKRQILNDFTDIIFFLDKYAK
jgi:hypothetical protein